MKKIILHILLLVFIMPLSANDVVAKLYPSNISAILKLFRDNRISNIPDSLDRGVLLRSAWGFRRKGNNGVKP